MEKRNDFNEKNNASFEQSQKKPHGNGRAKEAPRRLAQVGTESDMNEQAEKQEFALGDNQANDFPAIDWELFRATFKGERDAK